MRRLVSTAAAAAVAALLSGTAAAKEVKSAKVCGASGCATVTGKSAHELFAENAAPSQTFDAVTGAYYTVEFTMADQGRVAGTYTLYWLPRPGLVRGQEASQFDPWTRTTAAQNKVFGRAARGIEPFRPRLARVLVGGRAVANPQSYARLFAHYPPAYRAAPEGARWITIRVTPAHPSPWIETATLLRYQPELRLLEKPGQWTVILPKAVGEQLVARQSLAPEARASGGSAHTALYAGVGAAGLAAVALAAFIRRRRRTQA